MKHRSLCYVSWQWEARDFWAGCCDWQWTARAWERGEARPELVVYLQHQRGWNSAPGRKKGGDPRRADVEERLECLKIEGEVPGEEWAYLGIGYHAIPHDWEPVSLLHLLRVNVSKVKKA